MTVVVLSMKSSVEVNATDVNLHDNQYSVEVGPPGSANCLLFVVGGSPSCASAGTNQRQEYVPVMCERTKS